MNQGVKGKQEQKADLFIKKLTKRNLSIYRLKTSKSFQKVLWKDYTILPSITSFFSKDFFLSNLSLKRKDKKI